MAQDRFELVDSIELSPDVTPEGVVDTAIRRGKAVADGWGVFEVLGGIARMPQKKLRSVWSVKETAEVEAQRLQESEGELQREEEHDPDSNAYLSTDFTTGHVTLVKARVELVITTEYKETPEPNPEPEQA